ncbi:DUF397 domain-containing protein [Nocardia sienata]|uniref:DUF397 domain-containing protein n=1 Tax=Nocardia sienata TaxID=248552 RepID=UPI0007A40790|nr:DUF397 domain-containing protein [Nocardia sienata]
MTSQDRLHWRTSSYSGTNGGQCVQVAFGSQTVFIRDSKYLRDPANDPAVQPIIAIDSTLWPRFLDHVKAGSGHPLGDGLPEIEQRTDGYIVLRDSDTEAPAMVFTPTEWAAFIAGAKAQEFDLHAA